MENTYTIGDILRKGLLKNHKGEAYKHKATVLKIVQLLKHEKIKTPFGVGYAVPQSEIDKHNKKYSG